MSSLEERVTALETRVEELAAQCEHATEIGVTAAREALTARQAHHRNIELLNALRKTQAEHTQMLVSHTQMLASHGQDLDEIKGKLGMLAASMHTIESLLTRLVNEDGSSE